MQSIQSPHLKKNQFSLFSLFFVITFFLIHPVYLACKDIFSSFQSTWAIQSIPYFHSVGTFGLLISSIYIAFCYTNFSLHFVYFKISLKTFPIPLTYHQVICFSPLETGMGFFFIFFLHTVFC